MSTNTVNVVNNNTVFKFSAVTSISKFEKKLQPEL